MTYAKLINGSISYAPRYLRVGDYIRMRPTAEEYAEAGYKPVTYTEPPAVELGYWAVESWTETDEAIVQGWTVDEVTELDGEEAMQMLFGGDENVE